MSRSVFDYARAHGAIVPFIKLKFKVKKNYSKTEKAAIKRNFKKLRYQGLIIEEEGNFRARFKFIKSAKDKQFKNAKGHFLLGVKPEDKVKNGKIVRDGYNKVFIPLDLSEFDLYEEPPPNYVEMIYQVLFTALTPHWEDIKPKDYFTMVLFNGYEVGQNQREKTPKEAKREGRAYAKGVSKNRKIHILAKEIANYISMDNNKYRSLKEEIEQSIIDGLFWYNFTKQRKLTKRETKLYSKKSGKKSRVRKKRAMGK